MVATWEGVTMPAQTTTLSTGPVRPVRGRGLLRSNAVQQTAMVVPTCLFLVFLTVYPFVYSLYLSLHQVKLTTLNRAVFVGLRNYTQLLTDGLFLHALGNTAVLAICTITLEVLIGFAAAKVFFELSRWRFVVVLRSLYLLPMMATPLIVGMIAAYVFNPTIGIANYLITLLGGSPVSWFGEPATAMAAMVLINVWQWSPFMMLLILAALTSIRGDMYEAARVDGAKWYHITWFIEIPSVLNVVLLGVILRIIDVLRFFDIVYITTRGGPGDSTVVVTLYAYLQDFQFFQVGTGSAAAVLILVISIVVTTFAVKLLRTVEHA